MNDKDYKSYFISDYEDSQAMIIACIEDMLRHNGYTWYSHNMGGFDSAFILKVLFLK